LGLDPEAVHDIIEAADEVRAMEAGSPTLKERTASAVGE
jgi:hypothetical protein